MNTNTTMPLLSPLDTSQYHHHTHRHRKRERAKSYCLPPYPVKKNLYPPQTPSHDSPPEIQSCLSLPWPRSGVHKSKRSPPDNSLKIIGRIFFREGGVGGQCSELHDTGWRISIRNIDWVRWGGSPCFSSTTCPAQADGAVWLCRATTIALWVLLP